MPGSSRFSSGATEVLSSAIRPSVTIEAPEFIEQGSPLEYSVVVENEAAVPIEFHLQGRDIVHDLAVVAEDGSTIWRRLEGQSLQAILRIETLAPRQKIVIGDYWDGRDREGAHVQPGSYTLQALLPTDDVPLVSRDRVLRVLKA
jgi:hypothetical protein